MDPVAVAQAAMVTQSALTQVNIGISALKMSADMEKSILGLLTEATVPADVNLGQSVDLTV